ncbi:MAG: ABC transporter permease [Acidobacteriota bacterium]
MTPPLLHLASRSLRNRRVATTLTIVSIAASVALLLGVEIVREGARDSFTGTITGTDLIVGARGGPLQLVLYSVFGLGSPVSNISFDTYQHFDTHPAVAWTVPISLGDSHRGYRVIATNERFFEHYRYWDDRAVELADGAVPRDVFDVAIGADVAAALEYKVGDPVVINHGTGAADLYRHDDRPFTVTGVIAPTRTPIDRGLYITLEGMTALHVDWESGAAPRPDDATPVGALRQLDLTPSQITSFYLGTRSRMDAFRLEREIDTYRREPISAVIPGVALAELWRVLGYGEAALRAVAIAVVLVGLLGMMVSLYTTLDARRRELAILRSIGAKPSTVVGLLVTEATLLATLGALTGCAAVYGLLLGLRPWITEQTGLWLPIEPPGINTLIYLGIVILAGAIVGLIPAWRAYRATLDDGLAIRL